MSQFEESNHDHYYDGARSAIKEPAVLDFRTALQDGRVINMRIQIDNEEHEFIKHVYELKLGPVDNKGRIDSRSELVFADYSIVLSTVMRFAMEYLTLHPDRLIGINSNNDNREHLRYDIIMREIEQVSRYFEVYGLNLYVRLNAPVSMEYENPFNFDEIFPETVLLSKELNIPVSNLYNYIVLKLKSI
ncbi:DUF6934 family protein [Chitinophaga sancti]|uniref:Uncharacterized protein n=1 Tax=Chitinophaga sancti TaxID=1004 RepID=A0A1K1SJ95_9BACT|nr:hypothetical protein [Chitinophaga sancti]WQD64493.1 hypothetical protein U0033_08810 [Chitinophaga sancti]WQG89883.1 hypothetical protein SR876_00110 [Chitinophaga sancti]SFW84496.1 hypothetical protein SAMN05661012_05565 [Chitinophaga sancti]